MDFVTSKANETVYIQVTEFMLGEEVRYRELAPLIRIRDNYPKVVLSLDAGVENDFEEVRQRNLAEWLVEA